MVGLSFNYRLAAKNRREDLARPADIEGAAPPDWLGYHRRGAFASQKLPMAVCLHTRSIARSRSASQAENAGGGAHAPPPIVTACSQAEERYSIVPE